MTDLRLLIVPYDSGHRGLRMGAGPLALADAGAAHRRRARGHKVAEQLVEPSGIWQAELRTAFDLQHHLADESADAHAAGEVPMLLAGNYNTTLGMLAGVMASGARVDLVWLDAHGDFNTPDTGCLIGRRTGRGL